MRIMMNLFLDTKCQLMKITRLLALKQKFSGINSKIKLSDILFKKTLMKNLYQIAGNKHNGSMGSGL